MPETYGNQEKVVFVKKDNFFVFFEKETQSVGDRIENEKKLKGYSKKGDGKMNCANCGMVIGEKDTVCRHCSAPVNNHLKVEQLGLLGQKTRYSTSRGAYLMGISGKIITEIEYASDCVLFNVKPKRFKKVDFVKYNDIASISMKSKLTKYYMILLVLGIISAVFTAGMGLLFAVAVYFILRDWEITIKCKSGNEVKFVCMTKAEAEAFCANIFDITGVELETKK